MGRLDSEGRTAVAALLKKGHSPSAVARLLGVTEGAVRYHRRRQATDAVDGRSKQESKASRYSEAIGLWRSHQEGGRVNLAALHGWLRDEYGYARVARVCTSMPTWYATRRTMRSPVSDRPSERRSIHSRPSGLTITSTTPRSSSRRAMPGPSALRSMRAPPADRFRIEI